VSRILEHIEIDLGKCALAHFDLNEYSCMSCALFIFMRVM